LLGLNRPEEAVRGYAQAMLLDANNTLPPFGRAAAQLMREDWAATSELGDMLWKSSDETARWYGAIVHHISSLFRGRADEALVWAERAASAYTAPGGRSATGHLNVAQTLLAQGRPDLAVKATSQALADVKGRASEVGPLSSHVRMLSAAGRQAEASAALATLTSLVDPLAPVRDGRNLNLTRGLAAMARGEAPGAIRPLEDAAAALTPRTGFILGASQHVPIWSTLGQAYFDAGRPADALPWFEKVAAAGVERVAHPLWYVRSFYYLGRIYEQQGNAAKAREAYRRFVGYWKDGDLDRDRVAEAQRKISS
jgi:tetratricopeptide (TPR) repeat protein